jgi:molecular chaperone GrpE
MSEEHTQPDMKQPQNTSTAQATTAVEHEQETPQNQPVEGEVVEVSETPAPGDDAVQQQVAALRAEVQDYKDQWQRAVADFKNYKRRTENDRTELVRTASSSLVLKLLPIIDDFERAIDSVPPEIAEHPWWQGTQLIAQKFRTILESEGVTEIEALGHEFDPNLHEAVLYEETNGQDGKVVGELRKGYKMHDRVLRASMVKVGKG